MLRGAFLLTVTGGAGALMLLVMAVVQRRTEHALTGLALLAILFAGGSLGGFVHFRTTRLRQRGWSGNAASWCMSALASVFLLVLLVRALLPRLELTAVEANRAGILAGWPGVSYLAIAAALFGMVMAEARATDEPAPMFIRPNDSVPRGTMLVWATIALVGWSAFSVLGRDSRLPIPEDAAAARQILEGVRAEARLRPTDAHTQLALGLSLMELRRFDEAQPVLELSERLAPDNSHPRNALGWMLNQQRRFAEAVPHLLEARSISPAYGEAHHNLAWALLNLERLDEAEHAYREAESFKPNDASLLSEYGWLLLRRNKPSAALAKVHRAARLQPANPRHLATASQILRSQARFSEAKEHLERALRIAPEWALLWGELGVTQYLLQDAPSATSAFAEAARRDSTYFADHPLELAMWRSAQQGRTGDIVISAAKPSLSPRGVTRMEKR